MQKPGGKIEGRARAKAVGWKHAWHIGRESNQSWQSRDEVRERMELGGQQMHIMLNFDVH